MSGKREDDSDFRHKIGDHIELEVNKKNCIGTLIDIKDDGVDVEYTVDIDESN